MSDPRDRLRRAFDPELFRRHGHEFVDLLADHLAKSISRQYDTVLPHIAPDDMLARWPGDFLPGPRAEFGALAEQILADSNNLQHPRYVGHQCCTPLPLAALSELLCSLINNGSAIYEMGPVNVAMEKRLVQWMCGLIGYGKGADGIFTHGGTLGNLTAFLAARQSKADSDVWKHGVSRAERLAVLVSNQCHYSVKRGVGVMGLGEDAVLTVPVDRDYHLDIRAARGKYDEAKEQGRKPFMIVANACSTATGSYDNINEIADFAEERDLWLHVDGAHGASALLSDKYRHLLSGLERADSVVWDAHKMLMTPALATALLFKDRACSYHAFSQKASYLFEKNADEEWYNYAHRTMECTKTMMGVKLYCALAVFGTDLFADFVTATYDLTRAFAAEISRSPDFELACAPQSNIICFRYLGKPGDDPDALQRRIRKAALADERYYIVQAELDAGVYLRCTIINPNTALDDLTGLLEFIRKLSS